MIKLEGVVINTFKIEAGKNKKGEEYEAADKVQLLGSLELPNGQIKNELIDLKVDEFIFYLTVWKFQRAEELNLVSSLVLFSFFVFPCFDFKCVDYNTF